MKERLIVMIIIRTMEIGNNSKTRHIEKSNSGTKISVNLKIIILIPIIIIIRNLLTERMIIKTTEVVKKKK